ncbi:UNVERIFIED_CONTAM: hypothetical protein Sradi_6930400 [Sesamum radiatum]|uniref:Uncharacterized protein n=1 Tax=Sesamum radiatum TaxID=300843 RepID=A0AAW2JGM5_SESRA
MTSKLSKIVYKSSIRLTFWSPILTGTTGDGGGGGGAGAATHRADCCTASLSADDGPDGPASSGVYKAANGGVVGGGEDGQQTAPLIWETFDGTAGSGGPRPRPRPRGIGGVPLDIIY